MVTAIVLIEAETNRIPDWEELEAGFEFGLN
jgi:hypothetical protein